MSRWLFLFLVSMTLLTAGCVTKGDDASPHDGAPRPEAEAAATHDDDVADDASPPGNDAPPIRTWINGVPCASGPEEQLLLIYEPPAAEATGKTATLTVPENTTKIWLWIEHETGTAGRYDIRIDGPDGTTLERSAAGIIGHGMTVTSGASGQTQKDAPTPGAYMFDWAAQGVFLGTRVMVEASVCP